MRLGAFSSWIGAVATVAACGNGFTAASSSDGGGSDGGSSSGDDSGQGSSSGAVSSSSGGSSSGGVAEGGPGQDWCATNAPTAKYCEDFDGFSDVQPFLSSWGPYSQNGATFIFDHTGVPSAPNALQVLTSSTSNVSALAIHVLPHPSTTLASQRLDFDFRVDQAMDIGVASAGAFAAILSGSEVASGAVALAIGNSQGPVLQVAYIEPSDAGIPGFGTASATTPFPTLGQWDGRYSLVITYNNGGSGSSGACAQLYAGAVAQLASCLKLPDTLAHPTAASIAIGVYSSGLNNTGTIGLRFDDVVYDAQ